MQDGLVVAASPSTITFTIERASATDVSRDERKTASTHSSPVPGKCSPGSCEIRRRTSKCDDAGTKRSEADICRRRIRQHARDEPECSAKKKKLDESRPRPIELMDSRYRPESARKGARIVHEIKSCLSKVDNTLTVSRSFVIPQGSGYLRTRDVRKSTRPTPARSPQVTLSRPGIPVALDFPKPGAQGARPVTGQKPKNPPAVHGARKPRTNAVKSRERVHKFADAKPVEGKSRDSLRTASSFRLDGIREKTSDLSMSTFIIEPRTVPEPAENGPLAPGSRERGKNKAGEDTPVVSVDGRRDDGSSDDPVGLFNNLLVKWGGTGKDGATGVEDVLEKIRMLEGSKIGGRTPKRKKKGNVRFKIYRRTRLRDMCGRRKSAKLDSESSVEESESGKLSEGCEYGAGVWRRSSEPCDLRSFVWRNQGWQQREKDKSALSVNSSLAHMNCDEVEEFSFWERAPTAASTSRWEAGLYKWKKSWSVLSVSAFRYNRLCHVPGEILQILRNADGFHQRGPSIPLHKIFDGPRKRLALADASDVEPSIFQKNIDIRNWLDALHFHGNQAGSEDERTAADERGKFDLGDEKSSKSRHFDRKNSAKRKRKARRLLKRRRASRAEEEESPLTGFVALSLVLALVFGFLSSVVR